MQREGQLSLPKGYGVTLVFAKLKILFGIAIIFYFSQSLILAEQAFTIIIRDGIQLDSYTYEFDIYIRSNEGEFELTSFQCSLCIKNNDFRKNQISFFYIENSSELNNIPSLAIGVNKPDSNLLLTLASFPGTDNITEEERRVGRFAIESSIPFSWADLGIKWNFEGNHATILTGNSFTDITNSGYYSYVDNTTSNEDAVYNPIDYSLKQNYPNPFNPSTIIRFSIPQNSYVELKVYNPLGEEIAILLDKYYYQGTYEVKFRDKDLPSGLYVYSLFADNKLIDCKKMILVK